MSNEKKIMTNEEFLKAIFDLPAQYAVKNYPLPEGVIFVRNGKK
mgnify:CR=1 FL=1